MSVLSILLTLAIFGFILWLVTTYIPMPSPVKTVIIAIAVIFMVLWMMNGIGLLAPLNTPLHIH